MWDLSEKKSIRNDVSDVKEGGACDWKVHMDKKHEEKRVVRDDGLRIKRTVAQS